MRLSYIERFMDLCFFTLGLFMVAENTRKRGSQRVNLSPTSSCRTSAIAAAASSFYNHNCFIAATNDHSHCLDAKKVTTATKTSSTTTGCDGNSDDNVDLNDVAPPLVRESKKNRHFPSVAVSPIQSHFCCRCCCISRCFAF